VEHDAVVKAFLGELGDARDMAGREIGAQANDDIAAIERHGQGIGFVSHSSLLDS